MEVTSPDQAREAIAAAASRATERYLATLTKGADPIKFSTVLDQTLPPMVARVLRSVEESFWRRELARREHDPRFHYGDPSLRGPVDAWDEALRGAMVLTVKELRQLVGRALTLQLDAIIAPIDCMKTNYFAREESLTAKNAVIIAKHLGLEERYVRALTLFAQDAPNHAIKAVDFQRLVKDVDAKEHGGSQDLAALDSLAYALLVLGLRQEDEPGETPADLALAFMVLRGTPAGVAKMRETLGEGTRADLIELQNAFTPEQSSEAAVEGESGTEEVSRFLEDIGADGEVIPADEAVGGKGGVQFVLTEEEKQAYVARAVGRHVHLVDPIMKVIEGALTWEEVDRVINDMLPDDERDEDLSARSFKSRIR